MFSHLNQKIILSTESVPIEKVRDNVALINHVNKLSPSEVEKMKIIKVSNYIFIVIFLSPNRKCIF